MRIPLVRRWWLLSAAATLSIYLTSPVLADFLDVPELKTLGLGFKVLPPMSTITQIGENVTIPCQPIETKRDGTNVTWFKDSRVVNYPRHHVLPNGTLIITKIEESDRAIYRCVLSSGNYSVTSAFSYLRLPVTGVWQLKPLNNTVREGRAVRLECLMASLPEASYIWLKDEKILPENETRYYQPKPGVLQITNVQMQDQGLFKCQAVNPSVKKKFISNGGHLNVIPRQNDDGTSFQHSLLGVASKVEAYEGEKAVLECITDDEEPLLEWSRIDESPIPKNTIRMGQGSLVFPSLTEEDTGVYNCTAVSKKSWDPISTNMVTLSMATPPTAQLSMTVSRRPTNLNSEISNGDTVRITCATWGTPAPSISWYKNGILHVGNGRHKYTSKNSSKTFNTEDLYIGNIMFKDMGVYQCVTRNNAGVDSDGFILKIYMPKSLPKPPINVRAVKLTSSIIKLSWTPLTDSNVSGYIINYKADTSLKERQHIANKTSALFKDLENNSNYIFYVRPFIIKTGSKKPLIGEPSNNVIINTKDSYHSNPTKMPVVMLYPISSTELYANWTIEQYTKNQNPITEQIIQWRKKRKHYHHKRVLASNITENIISSLDPNKAYEVRVLVSTISGYPLHKLQLDWYTIKMPHNSSDVRHDDTVLDVHLSTCSQRPTEILVNWTVDASLETKLNNYHVFYSDSTSSRQQEQATNETSFTLVNLAAEKCYGVWVQAIIHSKQNGTSSTLRTICTLSQPPFMLTQQTNTDRMRVKKLRAKVLSTTSVLVTWKYTSRKLPADFYTIKVENVKSELNSYAVMVEERLSEENDMDLDARQRGARSSHSMQYEEDAYGTGDLESEAVEPLSSRISFYRVTNQRLTVTNLRPLNNYSVTVTASTTALTGHPSVTFVSPDEGVPTPPLNVTWVPASPKDVILTWNPPRYINGRLLHYQVAFSHDEQEWRNQTVSPYRTTTQIEDLVSNTNYTLHIVGETGKGMGAPTTIYIYIRATLEGEPHITTELAVIGVVSFLVIATFAVAVLLCLRILRLRNNSPSVFQGNGACRMVYNNGVKSPGRDNGSDHDDYKPMLASLPPAIQNHHLDTKGGPGSHDDGVVANSLFDPSAIQMNQDDGTSEGMEPLRDCLSHHRMLNTLDDIDDADDGSRKLLQSASTAQPAFSRNMKEFNSKYMYDTTQVGHHFSDNGAGTDPAVST